MQTLVSFFSFCIYGSLCRTSSSSSSPSFFFRMSWRLVWTICFHSSTRWRFQVSDISEVRGERHWQRVSHHHHHHPSSWKFDFLWTCAGVYLLLFSVAGIEPKVHFVQPSPVDCMEFRRNCVYPSPFPSTAMFTGCRRETFECCVRSWRLFLSTLYSGPLHSFSFVLLSTCFHLVFGRLHQPFLPPDRPTDGAFGVVLPYNRI